jgi:hypothetical protein
MSPGRLLSARHLDDNLDQECRVDGQAQRDLSTGVAMRLDFGLRDTKVKDQEVSASSESCYCTGPGLMP